MKMVSPPFQGGVVLRSKSGVVTAGMSLESNTKLSTISRPHPTPHTSYPSSDS